MKVDLFHFILAVTLAIAPDLAVSSQEDESRVIAKVTADGTIFGFAQVCNVSDKEIKSLFDLILN